MIAGLVSISGVANNCQNWCAIVIGSVGSILYMLACKLWEDVFFIDDPIESSQTNFLCGIWGIIATGLFDNNRGVIYKSSSERGKFFAFEIIGMISILGWISIFSLVFYTLMRRFGLLRVDRSAEIIGLDYSSLGGINE
jgi:Amt family ammonium transporter